MASATEGNSQATTRRTIITKFVLENFKSYAGIREIGPMHKRFGAVVGPNGSGKSNLIDALLFIFGKRAKKLRMKNLSSLIHNSAEHPNAKEARVEIHFCEIDDADPITASDETDLYNALPESEFVLARTVRLDNTAFYTLNGKRVAFDDVETFMKTKGIDVNNNRFLILQGEVEAISMMKPKGETKHEEGMLEFLEELIGTDRYVEDIEKSQTLVEALSQNRALRLEQVKVGEKEMAALEGPKDEAMRFRFLEMSICENKCNITAARLAQCEAKCVETEQSKAAISEGFGNKKVELDTLARQVTLLEDEAKLKKQSHASILKALEDHKEAFAKFERKQIKDETKTKQLAAKVEKFEAAVVLARKTKKAEEERIIELESSLPTLSLAVEKHEKALTIAEESLEKVRVDSREEARGIREEIEKRQLELAPLSATASALGSEVDLMEKEFALLAGPSEEAKKKLPEQQKKLKEVIALVEAIPTESAEVEKQVAELKDLLSDCELRVEEMRTRETDLDGEISTVSSQLKTSQSGDNSKRSAALRALAEATKPGGELDGCGFLGRLGDLGTVPDEYDTAATTAGGGILDNFVTRTVEDAERCVQFMRSNNISSNTFIILSMIAKVPSTTASSFPAPRVFDLIKPRSEELAPAFYKAVQDTLVCSDLDEATRVAFEESTNVCRHRVVTLRGELIERVGTMTGGGKPRKGGFASSNETQSESLVSEKELASMKAKLTKAEKDLASLREGMTKENKLVGLTRNKLTGAQDKLEALAREEQSLKQKLKLIETRIAELTLASVVSNEDKEKMRSIRKVIDEKTPAHEEAKNKAHKIQQAIEALNLQLGQLGGQKGKELRDAVEKTRADLDKARAALTKAQVDLESSRASFKKAEKENEKMGAELEMASAEQEAHETEQEKTREKAKEAQDRFEEAKVTEQQSKEVMEASKRELNECKARLNALESGSVEMKLKLEQAEDEHRKALARKSKWEAELAQARSRFEEWRKTAAGDEPEVDGEGSTPAATLQMVGGDPLSDADLARLENEVARLEGEAKSLRGQVNMGAIAEYREREKDYLERVKELDEASLARDQARAQLEELKKKRLVEFMHGFSIISLKLKEIYQLITLGGDAELELVDSLDPFSEGVVFSVRPPKKSWKNISNLSGGEKTLSSLSLVFALHAFRGAPLYVMDEIDAALDFKNVSIVANYIKERTKNAQFLIISLRNNMFELADRLVGVYKTNNATKTVTINPDRVALRSGIVPDDRAEDNDVVVSTASSTKKVKDSVSVSVLGERDANIS